MALLDVQSIDVHYGSIQALRGVSLRIEDGEMVALLGANGAGKTTTLRTISGLLAPTRGTIAMAGEEIGGLPAHEVVKHGIAHLPEGRDLFPTLTVEENLRFGYLPRRKDRVSYAATLERAFEHFPKLQERRRQAAGTLSGGEQQMLGIARALMSSPRLLIVDELSLGLAPIIVEQLFRILREVNEQGTSILIVEQFVHMALANTHRAYVLAKGEVVLEDSSARLESDPKLVASYLGEAEAGVAHEEKEPPAKKPPRRRAAPRPAARARSASKPRTTATRARRKS
jgi:branched-chain amino acid transport system ATP-binding protein